MAFVLALFVLAGAMWLIATGHDVAGTTIATVDLVGLVGTFIYSRRDQRKQEERRQLE